MERGVNSRQGFEQSTKGKSADAVDPKVGELLRRRIVKCLPETGASIKG